MHPPTPASSSSSLALADSPVLVGVVIVLVAGAVLALGFALREAPALVRILTARSTDVFSLATGTTGPTSIAGRAIRHEEVLEGPFTGEECLAVAYEMQEERSTQHGTTWVEIDDGRALVPFRLEDDSGSVLVDAATVRLSLEGNESTVEVASDEEPPARIREFVERDPDVDPARRTLDLRVIELDVGSDRRYVERRLEPGQEVRIVGEARDEPGVGTEVGQVNAVLTDGAHPLVISDSGVRWTVLRVFWPVLIAAAIGVGLLSIAIVLAV